MGQVSYGTITITDTNDIESITVEYARNQDPTNAPDTGWDTTRPNWEQGYYIWQRTRIHKSGTSASSDTFGAAVCLTGSTGSTGASGRSLTATETKYTNVTSSTTQAQVEALAESAWSTNVPNYDAQYPVYWVRIKNTYSSNPTTEYIYYKDGGLSDAVSKAATANINAANALEKANSGIIATTQLWYQTNSTTAPSVPTQHTQVDVGSSTVNNWRSTRPTNKITSYKYYYYCYEYKHGDNTYSYSAEAILDTSNLSTYDIGILQAKVKNYWWDSNGAHIASGKSGNEVTTNTISTYGYHTLIGLTGISFNYDNAKVVDLNSTTPSLDFYQPPTISGSTVTQGKKTMMLSSNALRFYNPTDGTTEQAVLDTNGLVLKKGGVIAGTANQSGFIYLSTEPYGSYSINGSSGISDWKEIIGTKFGVRADGTLYANNAVISGTIAIGSGSTIDSGATVGGTSLSNIAQNASTGAQAASDLSAFETTVSNTYATQEALSEVEGQIPDVSGLASKSAAITEEQLIYIQATSGTNSVNAYPSSSTTTSSYWVTQTGESIPNGTPPDSAAGQTPRWTTKRPSYQKNYPVIFVAKQKKTVSGAITCTTPIKDDTTTIIDGGHIITGTIDASKVTVTNLQASSIAVGNSNVAAALDTKASNSAEYEVIIKVDSVNYITPEAKLIAIPTKLGASTTGTFTWYKNTIGTAHGGTVSTTTTGNTNDTLTVSDLEATYIAVLN